MQQSSQYHHQHHHTDSRRPPPPRWGQLPEPGNAAILRAAAVGDLLSLETEVSLRPGAVAKAVIPGTGCHALHLAVEGGHLECIAVLADACPGLVATSDDRGFHPIDYAAAVNDIVAMELLLHAVTPADVNTTHAESLALRVHRDLESFKAIQDWKGAHGAPQSPLISQFGVLSDDQEESLQRRRQPNEQQQETGEIIPVANHVSLPGETLAAICFSYGTTPRELRYLNADHFDALAADPIPAGTELRVPLRASLTAVSKRPTRHLVSPHSAEGDAGTSVVLEDHFTNRVTRRATSAHALDNSREASQAADTTTTWRHETTREYDDERGGADTSVAQRTTATKDDDATVGDRESSLTVNRRVVDRKTRHERLGDAEAHSGSDLDVAERAVESANDDDDDDDDDASVITTTTAGTLDTEDEAMFDTDSDNENAQEAETTTTTTTTKTKETTVAERAADADAGADEVHDCDREWDAECAARRQRRAEQDAEWERRRTERDAELEAAIAANDEDRIAELRRRDADDRAAYEAELRKLEEEELQARADYDRRRAEALQHAEARRQRRLAAIQEAEDSQRRRASERDAQLNDEIDEARRRRDEDAVAELEAERQRRADEDAATERRLSDLRKCHDAEHARRLRQAQERRNADARRRADWERNLAAMREVNATGDHERRQRLLNEQREANEQAERDREAIVVEERHRAELYRRRVKQLDEAEDKARDAARDKEAAEEQAAEERRRRRAAEVDDELHRAREAGDAERMRELESHQAFLEESDARRRRRVEEEDSARAVRERQTSSTHFANVAEEARRQEARDAKRQRREREREAAREKLQSDHDALLRSETDQREQERLEHARAEKIRQDRLEESRARGDRQRELELRIEQQQADEARREREQRQREADEQRQRDLEEAMIAVETGRAGGKRDGETAEERVLRAEKREIARQRRRQEETRRRNDVRAEHEREQQRLVDEAKRRGDERKAAALQRDLDQQRRDAEQDQRRREQEDARRQAAFEKKMEKRRRRLDDDGKAAVDRKRQLQAEREEDQWEKAEAEAARAARARQRRHDDEMHESRVKRDVMDKDRRAREEQHERLLRAARAARDTEREQQIIAAAEREKKLQESRDEHLRTEEQERQRLLDADLRRIEAEAEAARDRKAVAAARKEAAKEGDNHFASRKRERQDARRAEAAEKAELRAAVAEAEREAEAEARAEDADAAEERKRRKAARDVESAKSKEATEEEKREEANEKRKKAVEAAKQRIEKRRAEAKAKEAKRREQERKKAEARKEDKEARTAEESYEKRLADLKKKGAVDSRRANSPSTRHHRDRSPSATTGRGKQAAKPDYEALLAREEEANEQRRLAAMESERERTRNDRLAAMRAQEAEAAKTTEEARRKALAEERLLALKRRDEEDARRRAEQRDGHRAQLEADRVARLERQRLEAERRAAEEEQRVFEAKMALNRSRSARETLVSSPLTPASSPTSAGSPSRRPRPSSPAPATTPTAEERRKRLHELRQRRLEYGNRNATPRRYELHDQEHTVVEETTETVTVATGGMTFGAGTAGTLNMDGLHRCVSAIGAFAPLPRIAAEDDDDGPQVLASLHAIPSSSSSSPLTAGGEGARQPESSTTTTAIAEAGSTSLHVSPIRGGRSELAETAPLPPSAPPAAERRHNANTTVASASAMTNTTTAAVNVLPLRVVVVSGARKTAQLEHALSAVISVALAADCDVTLLSAGPRDAAALTSGQHFSSADEAPLSRDGLVRFLEDRVGPYKGPAIVILCGGLRVTGGGGAHHHHHRNAAPAPSSLGDASVVLDPFAPAEQITLAETAALMAPSAASAAPRLLLADIVSPDGAGLGPVVDPVSLRKGCTNGPVASAVRLHVALPPDTPAGSQPAGISLAAFAAIARAAADSRIGASTYEVPLGAVLDALVEGSPTAPPGFEDGARSTTVVAQAQADLQAAMCAQGAHRFVSGHPARSLALTGWRGIVLDCDVAIGAAASSSRRAPTLADWRQDLDRALDGVADALAAAEQGSRQHRAIEWRVHGLIRDLRDVPLALLADPAQFPHVVSASAQCRQWSVRISVAALRSCIAGPHRATAAELRMCACRLVTAAIKHRTSGQHRLVSDLTAAAALEHSIVDVAVPIEPVGVAAAALHQDSDAGGFVTVRLETFASAHDAAVAAIACIDEVRQQATVNAPAVVAWSTVSASFLASRIGGRADRDCSEAAGAAESLTCLAASLRAMAAVPSMSEGGNATTASSVSAVRLV